MLPDNIPPPQDGISKNYVKKVWIAVGIAALAAVVLLLFTRLISVLLLLLAGALVALFFQGLGALLHRYAKLPTGWAVVAGVVLVAALATGFFALTGFKIQAQLSELQESFPLTLSNARQQLQQLPLGQKVINQLNTKETQDKLQTAAATLFKSSFGIFGDIYIILFMAMYFMVDPQLYKKGMAKLAPLKAQPKTLHILEKLGSSLQKWLKGKLFAMMVTFVLTAIGLLIIGMPMWLTLALIAGLLNFIPNFGPIIAMVPAVLVALLQGPATAGIVAGLYVLVQLIESNFITPLVQQKLLSIPPALIIIAQLAMAALTGGWGILLATPIVVIIMIIVQETYTENRGLSEQLQNTES